MSDQYVKLEEERRHRQRLEKDKRKKKKKEKGRPRRHSALHTESDEDIAPAQQVDIVTEEMPEVSPALWACPCSHPLQGAFPSLPLWPREATCRPCPVPQVLVGGSSRQPTNLPCCQSISHGMAALARPDLAGRSGHLSSGRIPSRGWAWLSVCRSGVPQTRPAWLCQSGTGAAEVDTDFLFSLRMPCPVMRMTKTPMTLTGLWTLTWISKHGGWGLGTRLDWGLGFPCPRCPSPLPIHRGPRE